MGLASVSAAFLRFTRTGTFIFSTYYQVVLPQTFQMPPSLFHFLWWAFVILVDSSILFWTGSGFSFGSSGLLHIGCLVIRLSCRNSGDGKSLSAASDAYTWRLTGIVFFLIHWVIWVFVSGLERKLRRVQINANLSSLCWRGMCVSVSRCVGLLKSHMGKKLSCYGELVGETYPWDCILHLGVDRLPFLIITEDVRNSGDLSFCLWL